MNWQVLADSRCELGESPFWHPSEQQLYWVDIPGQQVLRCQPGQGAVQRWNLDQEPGCIAPAQRGPGDDCGLVLALRDGIYRARQWGGALQKVVDAPYDTATTRFNDGKCDPLGRFWAGSMYEPRTANLAELWCLDRRPGHTPSFERKIAGALTANGLAWSPDAATLYWANTPEHVVWSWPFGMDSATLGQRQVFHQFAGKPADWSFADDGSHTRSYQGRPDGAAVDSAGNYWAAMFEGQRVCQFAPDGRLLQEWAVPALCVTMPCFGGDDLRTLFVTTACKGRSEQERKAQPNAGSVFSMRVEVPGLPVNFYQD